MGKIFLNDVELDLPPNWTDQGMITFTLPSPDKNVKPNVILTKERLPEKVTLKEYFERLKQAIAKRGIKDFKILEEKEILLAGQRAISMICTWDVTAMKKAMAAQQAPPGTPLPEIKSGQVVKQIQVTVLKEQLAVNLTGSFPADQFDLYYRPFLNFLKTLKFV